MIFRLLSPFYLVFLQTAGGFRLSKQVDEAEQKKLNENYITKENDMKNGKTGASTFLRLKVDLNFECEIEVEETEEKFFYFGFSQSGEN